MDKSVTRRLTGRCFKMFGGTGLWYIAISLGLHITIFLILSLNVQGFVWQENIQQGNSTAMFLFVLGIVWPIIYTPRLIALGITRRQLWGGMFYAAALICAAGTAVHALCYALAAVTGHPVMASIFIPMQALRDMVIFLYCFLLGWGIAVGFLYKKVVTAVVSIIAAMLGFGAAAYLIGEPITLPTLAQIAALAALGAVIAWALRLGIKKMPIRA